jgi:hypothetical protein
VAILFEPCEVLLKVIGRHAACIHRKVGTPAQKLPERKIAPPRDQIPERLIQRCDHRAEEPLLACLDRLDSKRAIDHPGCLSRLLDPGPDQHRRHDVLDEEAAALRRIGGEIAPGLPPTAGAVAFFDLDDQAWTLAKLTERRHKGPAGLRPEEPDGQARNDDRRVSHASEDVTPRRHTGNRDIAGEATGSCAGPGSGCAAAAEEDRLRKLTLEPECGNPGTCEARPRPLHRRDRRLRLTSATLRAPGSADRTRTPTDCPQIRSQHTTTAT